MIRQLSLLENQLVKKVKPIKELLNTPGLIKIPTLKETGASSILTSHLNILEVSSSLITIMLTLKSLLESTTRSIDTSTMMLLKLCPSAKPDKFHSLELILLESSWPKLTNKLPLLLLMTSQSPSPELLISKSLKWLLFTVVLSSGLSLVSLLSALLSLWSAYGRNVPTKRMRKIDSTKKTATWESELFDNYQF